VPVVDHIAIQLTSWSGWKRHARYYCAQNIMTISLGAVADDYTGASDLANTLTRNGLRTIQTIGVPDAGLALPEVDAVVVALKTRSIAAGAAVARARAAAGWLRKQGAAHILFKICSTFDSTPAGNIGPVTDALAEDAGARIVLVTPAFPETGRTVYQGNLFVGAVPLNESPLRDHPLNPMHDANLMRVLGAQSRRRIGLVAFDVVEQGAAAVRARLVELADAGFGAAIADAVTEQHLLTLGAVAVGEPISTGASGLGLGLARALVAQGGGSPAQSGSDPFAEPVGGRAAILAGSCSEATRGQIAAVEGTMPVLRLDIPALLAGGDMVQSALAWADEHLAEGPVLIASSAPPELVAQMRAQHQGEQVGETIETALAGVAVGLVGRGVRRLIVAGGETSGAVTDRLGITGFLVGSEIAPGVPMLRTLGGGDAMLLALKSGNFGGPDFFSRALAMMR
jgi:uncharacterized protein YgbK (DUF1537 family)